MRPIDADIIIKNLTGMKSYYDAIVLDGMIKALQEAPTIKPEAEAMERILEKLETVGGIETVVIGGRERGGRTFASGFQYGIETAIEIVKAELGKETP